MKLIMTAVALAIAAPALAQTAADPHAAHKGHAPAAPQGEKDDCCDKGAHHGHGDKARDCCDESRNGGKAPDCCDKDKTAAKDKAGAASGHDAHSH